MAFSPLQQSFAGGELDPRFWGLSGTDLYKVALAECLNWEVLPGGALRKAGATRYVANLISGGSRLIPFRTAAGLDYVLELGNLVGRIYTTAGRAAESADGSGTELVVNGGFTDATGWTVYLGSISVGRLRLNSTRSYDPELKIYEEEFGAGSQVLAVPTAGEYQVTWSESGPGAAAARLSWAGGEALLLTPGTVTLPAGPVTLSIELRGAYPDYVLVDHVSVPSADLGISFELVTPWTLAELPEVQWVAETGRDRLILVHTAHAPFYVARSASGAWTGGDVVFAWKPPEWTGGPPASWPGVVEIHAGRLFLGQRNRLWASRVGALDDFRRYTTIADGLPAAALVAGTQVTPDCGLDLVVSTKAAGSWLKGQRTLLLGTDQGEHYVVGSNGGPPAAGNFDVLQGSAFGSAPGQAVAGGDQVLYVSADRRRLRAIGWELQADGWASHDLTWVASHLTLPGIRAVHFARAPYPGPVLELADGTLALACYDRAAQQLSWWRREIGGGTVLSACVTDGAYGSIVWLSVLRGATACLEYLRLDDVGEALLDGQRQQVLGADLAVTGLGHLGEGTAVEVVIGRTVIAAAVAGGQVVLGGDVAAAGDIATVGVPYLARAKTLPLEGGNPRGSAQASKRRMVKARVRLNASALPKVNGYRAAERSPATPMDQGQPAFTGDVDVATSGWEDDGQITIEQDLPLRTEILSLGGVAQTNQI